METTATQLHHHTAAYVRSVRARIDLAVAPHERRTIVSDVSGFLASAGAQFLTAPQRRNLERMRATAARNL